MNVTSRSPSRAPGAGRRLLVTVLLAAGIRLAFSQAASEGSGSFAFTVTADMRTFTAPAHPGPRYFEGACEAIRRAGAGAFMILPGDFDPPAPVRAALDRYFGTNYPSYFVAGNHEAETSEDVLWLQRWASNGIPHLVRRGPSDASGTTYSFDYGNSHFAVLDQYPGSGPATADNDEHAERLLRWLDEDLAATRQPLLWVAGHEPIESQPDMDSGRVRHKTDSLNASPALRDRFVEVLRKHRVCAYLCGHTHNASVAQVQGIWQLDAGHARGAGDPGAPSTFLRVVVNGEHARVEVHRGDAHGENYALRKTVELR
jgi:hypothetical protein